MPGALPTGGDTDYFDLGIWGILGAGLSTLITRDQDTVTDVLRADIQGSPGWGSASEFLFAGLNAALGFPVAFLKAIVENLLGLVVGADNIPDLLDLLSTFLDLIFGDIPIIGDIVEAITGIIDGDLFDLSNFFDHLFDGLIGGLVNGGQPINAINIFGTFLPGLFTNINIGALTNDQPNLLVSGNFPDAGSIEDNPVWTFDPTVTRSADSSGSARVEADGTLKALRSRPIQVATDRPMNISVYVKWQGLTFTGSPLKLTLMEFDANDNQVGSTLTLDSHTPTGADGGWVKLEDEYTPSSSNVKSVVVRLLVEPTATAGTVWFDEGDTHQTGTILQEWVQNLISDLQGILAWIETLVDQVLDALGLDAVGELADKIFDLAEGIGEWFFDSLGAFSNISDLFGNFDDLLFSIFSGLTGSSDNPGLDLPDFLDAIIDAFQNIPFLNVLGFGGPSNVGETFQSTWDLLISGFVGELGSGSGLADLFNIAQEIASRATLGLFSWDILGIRNNKSFKSGLLSTSESNVNLDKVALQSSAPTFNVTQSTAIMGFHRIAEAASKTVVSWLGQGVTNVTAAFINIFKMDTETGDLELVHASDDIVSELSGSMQYNIYELDEPIDVEPGEVYGIELAIRGAGSHAIVGQSTWLPEHPGVYPKKLSAVRNSGTSAPPDTIEHSSLTYSSNVPFFEFAVSAGEIDIARSPQTTLYNTSGTRSLPIPSWANVVEVIALGGGGGGRQGGTWGISGEGGDAGNWATDTWVRETDFTGSVSLSITVGAGGSGGSGQGGNGGTSSVTLPATTGHTSQQVTATGGEGGDALNALGSDKNGQSPGNITYGGQPYVGGGTQTTFGGKGAAPGGGGAGGNWVSFQGGGAGAVGAVWIRFKQS